MSELPQIKKIRTAIVDDHKMLLGALTLWISEAASDIEISFVASEWNELITHEQFPPDVVLLDLDLKNHLPIKMKLATLKAAGVQIVIMSTYSEPRLVKEALNNGAIGYLVKSEDAALIVEAIRFAHRGKPYISEELELTSAHEQLGGAPKLSAQEKKVVTNKHLDGARAKDVAQALGLSEETVKAYLRRVREKYRLAGIDVSDKVLLRKQVIRDGTVLDFD